MVEPLTTIIAVAKSTAATTAINAARQRLMDLRSVPSAISEVAKRHPFTNVAQCLAAFAETSELPSSEYLGSGTTFFSESLEQLVEISRLAGSALDHAAATVVLKDFFEAIDELRLGRVPALIDARNAQRFEFTNAAIESAGEQNAVILEQTTEILRRLDLSWPGRVRVSLDSAADPDPAHEQRISSRSRIRTMIELGQFSTAEAAISSYEDKLAVLPGDDYQLATWKLICAHEQGRTDEALAYAQAALSLKPNDAPTLSNAAAVALAAGRATDALNYATTMRRVDSQFSAANLLYALDANEMFEALDIMLASIDADNASSEIQHAVARICFRREQYDRAEQLLRCAMTISAEPDIKELLALTLLARGAFSRVTSKFSVLLEAESLLSAALAARRTWEAKSDAQRYQLNRAVVRALKCEYGMAIADCDAVLADDPLNVHAITTKALALSDMERPLEAWRLLTTLTDVCSAEITLQRGRVLVQLARTSDASRTLVPLLDDTNQQIVVAAAELLVQLEAVPSDEARFDVIGAAISDQHMRRVLHGCWHMRRKEFKSAIAELEPVVLRGGRAERSTAAVNLATAYTASGREVDAIRLYEQILDSDSDPMMLEKFCEVLCRAGRFGRAQELASSILHVHPRSTVARQVLGIVAEELGDTAEAGDIFAKLADDLDSAEYLLRAAEDFWRCQRIERAAVLLRTLPVDAFFDDAFLLLRRAELESSLGGDGSNYAYRAMMLSRSPEADAVLVRLWSAARLDMPQSDVVREDVAVTLRSDIGLAMKVVISNDPRMIGLPDHHSVSSDLAQALWGKREGDEVSFGGRMVAIVSISDRRDAARALALDEATVRHQEHALVRGLDPNELSSIEREQFDMTVVNRMQWRRRYLARECSLGRAAAETGDSTVRWWGDVTHSSDRRLFAGSFTDLDASEIGSAPLVIDVTTALTLAQLGLADVVLGSGIDIIATQTSIDTLLLTQRYELWSRSAPCVGSVVDGSFEMRQVDEDLYDDACRVVRDALRILASGRIVPTAERLDEVADDVSDLTRELGRCSADAVLVARQSKAMLAMDDQVARDFAALHGVRTVPTQALLVALRRDNRIVPAEYRDFLVALSGIGYSFLRVSVADINTAWVEAGSVVTGPVARLIAQLADPDGNVESVVDVASGSLMNAWHRSDSPVLTDSLVWSILVATVIGRDTRVLHRLVGRCIERGMPICRSWRRERFARGLRGIQDWTSGLENLISRRSRGKTKSKRIARGPEITSADELSE